MNRKEFTGLSADTLGAGLATVVLLAAWQQAHALALSDISNAAASKGLKAALEQGAVAAVTLLGQNNGFLNNPKVRIPMPQRFAFPCQVFLTAPQRCSSHSARASELTSW